MVHWMITADIDTAYGVISITIAIALGVLVFNPPKNDSTISFLVTAAVIASVALFVPMRSVLNRHALVTIDMDAIDRAYKQLEERPNNVGARFKIAKMIYQRGIWGHAIKIAEEALKGMPEEFFGEEHKLVESWRRQNPGKEIYGPLGCIECGLNNKPGELYCRRCGARFLLDQAKGRWIGKTLARKLMAGWIAMMGVFVGIPVAATALPPVPAMVAVAGIAMLVLTTLYAAFLGDKAKLF